MNLETFVMLVYTHTESIGIVTYLLCFRVFKVAHREKQSCTYRNEMNLY
jgi:hypothetical protein